MSRLDLAAIEAEVDRLHKSLDTAEQSRTESERNQLRANLIGALTWYLTARGQASAFEGMLDRAAASIAPTEERS